MYACHPESPIVRGAKHGSRNKGHIPVYHSRAGGNPGGVVWVGHFVSEQRNEEFLQETFHCTQGDSFRMSILRSLI